MLRKINLPQITEVGFEVAEVGFESTLASGFMPVTAIWTVCPYLSSSTSAFLSVTLKESQEDSRILLRGSLCSYSSNLGGLTCFDIELLGPLFSQATSPLLSLCHFKGIFLHLTLTQCPFRVSSKRSTFRCPGEWTAKPSFDPAEFPACCPCVWWFTLQMHATVTQMARILGGHG